MAEELGFEPRRQFPDLPVFKTGPFSHLGIPPYIYRVLNGGPCRTRTYDQPVMSPTSYQAALPRDIVVPETGLEPVRDFSPTGF